MKQTKAVMSQKPGKASPSHWLPACPPTSSHWSGPAAPLSRAWMGLKRPKPRAGRGRRKRWGLWEAWPRVKVGGWEPWGPAGWRGSPLISAPQERERQPSTIQRPPAACLVPGLAFVHFQFGIFEVALELAEKFNKQLWQWCSWSVKLHQKHLW